MISKLNALIDSFVSIEQRLGLRKYIKYSLVTIFLIALIPVALDPKGCIKGTVRYFIDLSNEIENDRMVERDRLMKELDSLLRELRAETGADRVVYYEYHNSIENEAGIPFKFCDLVQQAPRQGLPELSPLDNVNVSRFSRLYCAVRDSEVVVNKGGQEFYDRYPGFTEISNGSKRQIFVNIPGIQVSLGLVVIEYSADNNHEVDWDEAVKSALRQSTRINALISKFR